MNEPAPLTIATWLVEQRALSIIPVRPRSKKPAIAWAEFQSTRPTPDQLKTWFANGGAHNTGIVCGAVSRLVAIDCDSPEAIAWADAHLPPTPMVTRTAKGEHRFYRHPGVHVSNAVGLDTGDPAIRIDVRADGGYVVAPGSMHETGVRYTRVGSWPPVDDLPVFDPAWILKEADAAPSPVSAPAPRARTVDDVMRRARAYVDATPPAVEGQGGDQHTFQVCCRLVRGFDLSDAAALELLSEWNARCTPPWSERELQAKIDGARKYGDEPFGARRDAEPPRSTAAPVPSSSNALYGFQWLKTKQPKIVFIAERTSDVDALVGMGMPAATCLAAGGGWAVEHVRQLQGCGVRLACILLDDQSAGRARAEHIASLCHAVGVTPRVLPLSSTVAGWVAAGGTSQRLIQLADETSPWQAPAAPSAGSDRSALVVRLADVQPEDVSWLWDRRLARGKLTLLVGDGGLGKSTVSLAFAATLSRGARWPDGPTPPIGATVVLSAEDGLADTIRPRLDALGADCAQIYALQAVRAGDADRWFNLERDLDLLEHTVRETRAALVIIDPISAYFGKADSYKDTEIRGVLAPLAALADRTNACVLGIMHIGKGTDRAAQHRVLGGVGFVNSARIVLGVGRHPDDADTPSPRRVLTPIKQNICAPADTLAFSLDEGRLLWEAEPVSGVTADQVLGGRPATIDEDATDAEALINQLLESEDWPLPAEIAYKAAKGQGIHERTLRRAAHKRRIESKSIGGGKSLRWIWHRPAEPAATTTDHVSAVSADVPFSNSAKNLIADTADNSGHVEGGWSDDGHF